MFDFRKNDPEFGAGGHFAFEVVVNGSPASSWMPPPATWPSWPLCWAARASTPFGKSCPPPWTAASPR